VDVILGEVPCAREAKHPIPADVDLAEILYGAILHRDLAKNYQVTASLLLSGVEDLLFHYQADPLFPIRHNRHVPPYVNI
jgi:hypothetical protein